MRVYFPRRLANSLGARIFVHFGLAIFSALIVALVALTTTRDATRRLEALIDIERRMGSALKDLELAAEQQSDNVQAFLLSGDQRYLRERSAAQDRFMSALTELRSLPITDDGRYLLDDIERSRGRFEDSASSQLTLYRQGWQRSAIFLWRTDGQETRRDLGQRITSYQAWYESTALADVAAARDAGRRALLVAVWLVLLVAAGSMILGLRLSRSLAVRLGSLTATARAIERDDFKVRSNVAGRDEVAELGAAMNRMAEHLEASQRDLEESRQQLARSLEEFRVLAESASDVVYALDLEGRYRYVNPAIDEVTGYRPDELIGHHFSELLPDETHLEATAVLERGMKGEIEETSTEVEFLAKDGRRVPLELRMAVIRRDQQILGIQGIARDVTVRKAMEAQIRELANQERLRADRLQVVAQVGQSITRLTSLDELLRNIATLLYEVFGYERVAIFLVDPNENLARLRAWAGTFAVPPPYPFSMDEHQGIVGWVAAHGEAVRLGDVRDEPRYLEVPATAGTLSELAVPIRAAGVTLGVVDLESLELEHFDASDEAILAILADQIGTAIQNARLFEQQHNLAVAEERNRLAREIHDTLAQGLTAITLQLEVADALLDRDGELARPKIVRALELTRANLEEARRSVMDLRAAPLQERDLPAALENLLSSIGQDYGLQTHFEARDVSNRLPAAVEAGLYRIAQEGLTNVARHASASVVSLTLVQRADTLALTIQDDGRGLNPAPLQSDRRSGGFGLIGMQERARLLGGDLEISSEPGAGTRIEVLLPLASRRESAVGAGKV